MRPLLLFLHIEKAAGTTMHDILYANFFPYYASSPSTYVQGQNHEANHLSARQLATICSNPFRVSAAGGHSIRFFENVRAEGFEPILFTFLRDPVARYISHYHYQREVMKIERTFEEFLDDPFFSNFMCRKIADVAESGQAIEFVVCNNILLGLVERFDESLEMLKRKVESAGLCDKFSCYYSTRNQRANRYSQPARVAEDPLLERYRAQIIENNRHDIALYEFAVQRFEAHASAGQSQARRPLFYSLRVAAGKAMRRLVYTQMERRAGFNGD